MKKLKQITSMNFFFFFGFFLVNFSLFFLCMCELYVVDSFRAYKKLSALEAWENTRKAAVDAELKQIEVVDLIVSSTILPYFFGDF